MSDDGYANALTVAADILEDLRLPWTLFVSTHHIDTGERNPIFLIRLFAFMRRPDLCRAHFPQPLSLAEDRDATAEDAIRHLREMDMTQAQEPSTGWCGSSSPFAVCLSASRPTLPTWDQVRS